MGFVGSVAIIVTYIPKDNAWFVSDDNTGYALCYIFHGTIFLYTSLFASVASLTTIAVERYVKIVHSVLHRRFYRHWMIYVLVAVPWMMGVTAATGSVIPTTIIIDGHCCPESYYPSGVSRIGHNMVGIVFGYVGPVCTITFCYSRIVLFMRKRAAVAAGDVHSNSEMSSQKRNLLLNTIKILMMNTIMCVVTWTPPFIFLALFAFGYPMDIDGRVSLSLCLIEFTYYLVTPFMYAWQYDSVRNTIKMLLMRVKTWILCQ